MANYVCAVDVGTRSARAALFDMAGQMSARDVEPIDVHVGLNARGEYRSDDIWAAVCRAVRQSRKAAGVAAKDVVAIAFDATCSLVLLDRENAALPISEDGRDTIAWFDRRATDEALACSAVGGETIRRLGGAMSSEMQLPKLMWLRQNRPDLWSRIAGAIDLSDWLALRATGRRVHSASSLATKWPWAAGDGWDVRLLEGVGFGDAQEALNMPATGTATGSQVGTLTVDAAAALGLDTGTVVAAGLVDGYAGALGCRATALGSGHLDALTLVVGTSASVLALETQPRPAQGLWGPFAQVPTEGLWSHEGGIMNAGALLDHVLSHWPAIDGGQVSHPRILAEIETHLGRNGHSFADDLHVLPDFNGNRGPVGDPRWRGVVHGLRLDSSLSALAALYWRSAVALALTIDEVLDRFAQSGMTSTTLAATGGLARSDIIAQLIADVTGKQLVLPVQVDAVLLGTALGAGVAAGWFPDLEAAGRGMAPQSRVIDPDPARRAAVERDRRVFRRMQAHRAEIAGLQD